MDAIFFQGLLEASKVEGRSSEEVFVIHPLLSFPTDRKGYFWELMTDYLVFRMPKTVLAGPTPFFLFCFEELSD